MKPSLLTLQQHRASEVRDPEGFKAWLAAYAEWRSGDLSEDIPHPETFTTKKG